jgi:hypothetical protein
MSPKGNVPGGVTRNLQGLKVNARPSDTIALLQAMKTKRQVFERGAINLGIPFGLKACNAARVITVMMRD